jgi:hypothetical protein
MFVREFEFEVAATTVKLCCAIQTDSSWLLWHSYGSLKKLQPMVTNWSRKYGS